MSSKVKLGKKKRKNFPNFLFKTVLFLGLCYVAFSLIQIQVQISEDKAELNRINSKLSVVQQENQVLGHFTNGENINQYVEKIAREKLGYAKPDERVVYIIPKTGGEE